MFDAGIETVIDLNDHVPAFRELLTAYGLVVRPVTRGDHSDPYARLMDLVYATVQHLTEENRAIKASAAVDADDSDLFALWRENVIRHPGRLEKYIGGAETPDDIKDGLIRLRRDTRKGR